MTAPLQTLLSQANHLFRSGPKPAAIAAHRELLKAYPENPDSWYNLGVLLRQTGQYEAALEAYATALSHNVQHPEEVHLNRAVIYLDGLRDGDSAERELQAALSLKPDFISALLNLASLYEDRGDKQNARAAYDGLLALAPQDASALSRRAGLEFGETAKPMIAKLGEALARPGLPATDKAALEFALGRLHDSCGAYDAAFAAYTRANAHNRTQPHDRSADTNRVAETIAAFPAPEPKSGDTNAPVFILGMFRSGSTLIEQILASHPEITSGGELDLIPRFAHMLGERPEAIANASAEHISQAREAYRARIASIGAAGLVTDKRPDNVWQIGLIKRLFPDARIIYTQRHPLDNCLSVYFLHLNPAMTYANDLTDIAHHLQAERSLMTHWQQLYPDDILTVGYEDMIGDQRAQTTQILRFLGLDWDKACGDFHKSSSLVRTASVWQVREPIHARSVNRWRHYDKHIGPLKSALGLSDAQ